MRYLLLIPLLAIVFAAGYFLRPQPAPQPVEPRSLPVEPALIIPAEIAEPTTPAPGKDLAFEVIRAHFADVANPAEPAPMPRELGEPDPLAGPIAVTPPGRLAVPPRPPEPEPYAVVFSRTEVVSFPFGVTRRGPSGIREAQVWITRDDGDTWELLAKQGGETSPITARLPGEGLFGFRLVLVGGDGASGGPPKPRDPPELRIAYEKRDSVVPLGNLLGVEPAGEEGPMPRASGEELEELPAPREVGLELLPPPICRPVLSLWPDETETLLTVIGAIKPLPRSSAGSLDVFMRQARAGLDEWERIVACRSAAAELLPMPREAAEANEPSWILQLGKEDDSPMPIAVRTSASYPRRYDLILPDEVEAFLEMTDSLIRSDEPREWWLHRYRKDRSPLEAFRPLRTKAAPASLLTGEQEAFLQAVRLSADPPLFLVTSDGLHSRP